ncbi:unnamed protein product [Moneuplotes crassus]|uniref:Uncharacterized protein n=1 Tax=Euplotes crassus TaxID=5936 RepID=A0AAD1Y0M8_EUPCR|nr:unnamed protein product [Moneuplotes crassus]
MINMNMNKRTDEKRVLHHLNLCLVILDILMVPIMASYVNIDDFLLTLINFHGFFLFPSLVYHVFPKVITNFWYRSFCYMLIFLNLALLAMSVSLFVVIQHPITKLVMVVFILFAVLPTAMVSVSFMLLLRINEKQPERPTYMLGQDGRLYQAMLMV